MLLRGLGHQNDGDSLAARRGRKSESTSISILLHLYVSHSVSFPWCSFYPTLSMAHLSVFLSVFLALNWRLFPVLHLILNFVPIFIFRSSFPTFLLSLSHFVDLFATSKVRFIFYYFSCLSDMFKVILRLCDPLRSLPWGHVKFISLVRCSRYRYVYDGKASHSRRNDTIAHL